YVRQRITLGGGFDMRQQAQVHHTAADGSNGAARVSVLSDTKATCPPCRFSASSSGCCATHFYGFLRSVSERGHVVGQVFLERRKAR
ncbi:MAG: hypothetical protein WCL38_08315, partial [Actinomycetota bacterium]